jgi:hypothetical protein
MPQEHGLDLDFTALPQGGVTLQKTKANLTPSVCD